MTVVDQFFKTRIEYQGLTLKPMTRQDIPDLAQWPPFEEPQLSWANFPATTEELQKRWFIHQQKSHIIWIIARNPQDLLIGRCSITEPLSSNQLLYGIVVHPQYLGEGLGTKITTAMLRYVFAVTSVDAVWLESRYDNKRAQHTWEKIGFVQLGYHYRREVFGRYDRYLGYRFDRDKKDQLPSIPVIYE